MPGQDNDLPFGLYERLITASLKARLLRFEPDRIRITTDELDPAPTRTSPSLDTLKRSSPAR